MRCEPCSTSQRWPPSFSNRLRTRRGPTRRIALNGQEAHIPAEVAAGVKIAVPVTLRNTGNRVWPASQVFVSYHWFRDDRLVVWDGERTPLPRDLRAGSRAALSVRVATPPEPGSVRAEADARARTCHLVRAQGAPPCSSDPSRCAHRLSRLIAAAAAPHHAQRRSERLFGATATPWPHHHRRRDDRR